MIRIVKVTIATTLLVLSVNAQDPNGISLPRIIPPNPSSQEFQKFLGYPVSPATGLVDISIPLYNLQLPGISIPISLKYHSSGIKVEQSYGNVGYGWTLFPSFKISRTIMGKADELYTTDLANATLTQDQIIDMAPSPQGSSGSDGTTLDGQYDIFNVSLPNYNGAFILQRINNGTAFKAVPVPDAPIQIVVTSQNPLGFQIKDDKGVQYIFDEQEGTSFPVTGWMLTKIILPGINNIVTFHYVDGAANSILPSSFATNVWDQFNYRTDIDQNIYGDPYNYFKGIMGISGMDMYSYASQQNAAPPTQYSPTKICASIEFSNGKIQLSYSSVSSGTFFQGALQTITVSNNSQQVLQNISFTYQDFLLQKISIAGKGEYNMQYNSQRFTNVYDQDRWGYYNNKANPTMYPRLTLNINGYPVQFGEADLTADETGMKANSLEKIIYPTGGWSRFYYEANKFLHSGNITYGAGLRIQQIDTYDPVAQKTITKTYKYGVNESGYANLVYYPEDDSFIDERKFYGTETEEHNPISCRRMTISSHSRLRYWNFNLPLWYDQITEYTDGGKLIYTYQYHPDVIGYINPSGCEHNIDMIETLNNLVTSSPMLVKKEVYKGEAGVYTLLQEEDNSYDQFNQRLVNGLVDIPVGDAVGFNIWPSNTNMFWESFNSANIAYIGNPNPPFFTSAYSIQAGINNLISSTQKDFNGTSVITTTKTFDYDALYPYNLMLTQFTNSKNEVITERLYYPTSSSIPDLLTLSASQQQMINTLNASNRLTAIIQKSSFKNGTTALSSTLVGYKDWDNNILEADQMFTKTGNNNYESRLHFYDYDDKGNVTTVSKENDVKKTYLWGYNKTYPVAEIVDADYATASSYVTQSILDNPSDDATLRNHLNNLRNIPNAQVTTYTYKPLVGMTSATDINGRTTYYEYDGFGRLAYIRDKDNNILKKICYNYQGQTESCPLGVGNALKIGTFTRNNCGSGYVGSQVTYTVPANTYFGANADALAQSDVDAKGQAYANEKGTCTPGSNVFARLEVSYSYSANTSNGYNSYYDADEYNYYQQVGMYLRFYSDVACTQPYTITTNVSYSINASGYMETMNDGIHIDPYTISGAIQGTAMAGSSEVFFDDLMSFEGFWGFYREGDGWVYYEKWRDDCELGYVGGGIIIQPPIYPQHSQGY